MRSAGAKALSSEELTPEEILYEESKSFKTALLRLLMKQREDVARRLIELDFDIWALEEFFRTDTEL